jgi:sirohydrochlorin ferrochelatase
MSMTSILGRSAKALFFRLSLVALIALSSVPARTQPREVGIVLLAHGGSARWNQTVGDLRAQVDERAPTEMALGMATRATIQAAVDRLTARGVREIVAVPLFISSHSSVVDSTAYLLGARADAPPDLAVFARMNHGAAPAAGDHAEHADTATKVDGTRPVASTVPIRMAKALDDHPIVADILVSRAGSLRRDPAREAVVLVAHGPVPDADNALWLADMGRLAVRVRSAMPFAQVEAITVRDDAPAAVRDAATAELRGLVTRLSNGETRVLIVPLLLSYGGIEAGIRKRLEGLEYTMAAQGVMPDDRVRQWVLDAAGISR